MSTETFQAGLEGVVAAQTRLSGVDGQAGELIIGGYAIEELAERATFEETIYLLWRDALPDAAEFRHLTHALAERRAVPSLVLDVLKEAAAQNVAPIDALRMACGMLNLGVVESGESEFPADALTLVAAFPTLIAAYWRLLHHQEPIGPCHDLGHAANYLYMLSGAVPNAERVRGLETYLSTVVDHGLNASTFTARVIIATQSDLISAVVGAVGALKGPLHGGAPGPALDMVFEIGEAPRAEAYLRTKLERGERLMGFGHRIYKVRDPRADVLARAAERLYRNGGDLALYELAKTVEQTALRLLEEFKPGRHLQTNVEFYTALLLHGLDLPTLLFTPTFAIGRVVGWIAHCFEQQRMNRVIRPQSVYVGARHREWLPLDAR